MKIQFYLRFHTSFGQTLWISDNQHTDIIPMTYINEEFWEATIRLEKNKEKKLQYNYILKTKDGEVIPEWGDDRTIDTGKNTIKEVLVIDTWNHAGEIENAFYTAPFREILIKQKKITTIISKKKKSHTHIFRIKAPLLSRNQVICMLGNTTSMGKWSVHEPVLFKKEGNWWSGHLDLSEDSFPMTYKYGVFDIVQKKFIQFEVGDNRLLYGDAGKKKLTIIHDGFARLPNNVWKGAGVSVPVFSLKSKKSFGIGEFTDLKELVDWAAEVGMKMIQILPVNDTTATHSWMDSYPYAAISAFALNPAYINLEKVAGKKNADSISKLLKKQKQLNQLSEIDYEEVMKWKLGLLKELYVNSGKETLQETEYENFFAENRIWLLPYAAFCYLRDKHGTSHFEQWPSHSIYDKKEVEKLSAPSSKSYSGIAFYYFVQYHLHLQLKDAAEYAHKKKLILKGDIPIGIYRYGCDAWTAPELYTMCQQAGAPPDDFAIKGQNWGFPTYNWKSMQTNNFEWWRKRFEQMSHYFDAFRIDHILGFFRIWSIPMHAVEGVMGHFSPAIPVAINEFGEKAIWFEHYRYCKPYITKDVLIELFGEDAEYVQENFLVTNDFGSYDMKVEFTTQRQVENYFDQQEPNTKNEKIRIGLYDLISNVILFEEEGSDGDKFHFRIGMEHTLSFKNLDEALQGKLKELYINYYFRRQDDNWKKEAMHKLPHLKRSTNMLVCGEDLGMVPHCVPEVMQQLGILSLEIQRMPKVIGKEFFHPNDAPYLSVVTPSTHDMSTIRGWWEEDREKTKRFYTQDLGQRGEAPVFCEPWINRAIVLQHLYSPAMWSVFQLQDLLGMSESLRYKDPHKERINIPANPKHYWRYRLHLSLEDLQKEKAFNEELKNYIELSGRA